jgi:hypothetical protein
MTIEKQARILVTRQRQRTSHRQSTLLSRAAAELGVAKGNNEPPTENTEFLA